MLAPILLPERSREARGLEVVQQTLTINYIN